MKVILKKLVIINFKGIQRLELEFDEKVNFIFGRNEAGKTTISDAYRWLLTGKNSQDAKDFEIKPIDSAGNRSEKLENEVSAVFEFDGQVINLRKVQSEKWIKPHGQLEPVFKGNEINCFWNNVPEKVGTFNEKIASFIPEEKLKLVTNTEYFNKMNWADRRAVLVDMAGDIDVRDLFIANKDYAFIDELMLQKKSMADFKREVAALKKKAKEEISTIPSRTDEVKRSMANLERPFERLREELSKNNTALSKIDSAINDINEAYKQSEQEVTVKRRKKYDLTTVAENISNSLRVTIIAARNQPDPVLDSLKSSIAASNKEISELVADKETLVTRIANGNSKIESSKKELSLLEEKINSIRDEWDVENKKQKVFSDNELSCPECNREYGTNEVEILKAKMIENFNLNKKSTLDSIVAKANKAKADKKELEDEIEKYKNAVTSFENELSSCNEKINQIKVNLSESESALATLTTVSQQEPEPIESVLEKYLATHREYQSLLSQIEVLAEEIDSFKPVDNKLLVAEKSELQTKIKEIETDLLNEQQIKTSVKRIKELNDQEKLLAQEIADLEKKEFLMMKFSIAEMNEVESRVNNMFKIVKFRMFDRQVNGEIVPVCDCLINGVPYPDVNTASKVNAGLDIINGLSNRYGLSAPVFVDCRESTTKLIETNSQLINLVVSPEDDKIRLSNVFPSKKKLEIA